MKLIMDAKDITASEFVEALKDFPDHIVTLMGCDRFWVTEENGVIYCDDPYYHDIESYSGD